MVEASLTVPLLLFLFLGATNFGFYIYAFISVSNAARVAAQYTANASFVGNQSVACQAVLLTRTLSPSRLSDGALT